MIGVDLTYILVGTGRDTQLRNGIELFIAELLDGFAALHLHSHFCLITNHESRGFFAKRFPMYEQCSVFWLPGEIAWRLTNGKKRLYRLRRKHHNTRFLKTVAKRDFSCIWFPFATPDSVIIRDERTFLTIHDIIPCHADASGDVTMRWKTLADSCRKIATISSYVRQDLSSTLGYEENSIHVVPNAISLNLQTISDTPVYPRPYILDINAYAPHKNTLTLIKAFERIADRIDLDLICCGGWKNEQYWALLHQYVKKHGLQDRVKMYYHIPTEQKNWLLKHAALFVMPSMDEGFGRTPVEAAICGIPVLSTKAASLYEATKGLVHYYDEPENDALLSEKLLECLQNPDSPEKLKAISDTLSSAYSIENCAAAYWEILKQYES